MKEEERKGDVSRGFGGDRAQARRTQRRTRDARAEGAHSVEQARNGVDGELGRVAH